MAFMKMIWVLCALCLAGGLREGHAGPIRKTGKTGERAAAQDQVNVLMFGVIQFSESINSVYETTRAKMAKIQQTVRAKEETLQLLGRQTEQAAEVKKQIKDVIELLQAQMAKQHTETKITKDWLAGMEKEADELRKKVKRSETFVNNYVPVNIKELQERAKEHSYVVESLQLLTQFQKENIETQNEQLLKLQEMSEAVKDSVEDSQSAQL